MHWVGDRLLAKNRIVAAVLNFFVWGLGYLYMGRRRKFGVLLVLGDVLPILYSFYPAYKVPNPFGGQAISFLAFLILSFAFAFDAYQLEGTR